MCLYILSVEFDSIAASRGGVGEGGAQARRLLSELLILLSNQKTKGKGAAKLTDTAPDSICTKKQKVESTSDSNDSLGCGLVIMAATNRIDVSHSLLLYIFIIPSLIITIIYSCINICITACYNRTWMKRY